MGRQKINKYMTLLLEHSILYFVLYARISPECRKLTSTLRNFTYEALAIRLILPSPPVSKSLYHELHGRIPTFA